MAPLATINRNSTPTIQPIQHERSQQRLRELLEQHNRQILPGQGRRVGDVDVLAKRVGQYAEKHDLSLPSTVKSLLTRYTDLPQSVLTAWWERKGLLQFSNVPKGKENRPPKPPTTAPAAKRATNTLPSSPAPSPPTSPIRAPKDYRVFPENRHPAVASMPKASVKRKPKSAKRTAAIPPSTPASPSTQKPPVTQGVSHPPSKRRKVYHKTNSSTENARKEATVLNHDDLRIHNKHARAVLKGVDGGNKEKQPIAVKRFLRERMNIFDATEGWESSPAYSGRPVRQEGEGHLEFLAKHGLF